MHQSVTDLASAGTRLYDSPARAELYDYGANNIGYCRSSSSAAFCAQLTGEHDRLLCSNETSDLRQTVTLCDHRTFLLRITFELLSLESCGYFALACTWQVEQASSPPSPTLASMPGTTSSYHDVMIWGTLFCISCSRQDKMYHVP